ncbi:hypothetical protein BV22DRAFT_407129 [Leucogyrophana mollusca]|uniref:Uncharacterized protein n=1 Tax=Leucogyrophana mollusca TaxID=85980 RepID=A0ACB8BJW0_9AGAM|nr:hypothetical protein BV22DRAFT_407129 [Leucogyrophana mollusca]
MSLNLSRSTSSRSSRRDDVTLVDIEEGDDKMSISQRVLHHFKINFSTSFLRRSCYYLHGVLIALHLCLVAVAIRHLEHSVVMAVTPNTNTLTGVLSVSLQAFYTLYSALLIYTTQRVSFSRTLFQRQSVAAIHDTTGAWVGLGAAFDSLWQQTKIITSPLKILAVTTYLLCITTLHISSSSVLQLQNFNSTVSASVTTVVGWPDPSVDMSKFDWPTVTSIVPSIGQLAGLTSAGLFNATVYDILGANTGIGNVTVNATTIKTSCALLVDMAYDAHNSPNLLRFQCRGKKCAMVLPPTPWKDQVIYYTTSSGGNVLQFLVTTAVDENTAVLDGAAIPLTWTYYPAGPPPPGRGGIPPGVNNSAETALTTYVMSCNISTVRTNAIVDVSSNNVTFEFGGAHFSSQRPTSSVSAASLFGFDERTPFSSVFSKSPVTDSSTICSAAELNRVSNLASGVVNGKCGYTTSTSNIYLMQLLGMNSTQIHPGEPFYKSDTTPSYTLSVERMEGALSQIIAEAIWTAGQLGTAGGGFDRSTGSADITQLVIEMRLNINWIPLTFALSASIILFALAIQMTYMGSKSPHKDNTIQNTGILELVWLASRLPELRDRIGKVDCPSVDNLRAAGMFDVLLAAVDKGDLMAKDDECTGHDSQACSSHTISRDLHSASSSNVYKTAGDAQEYEMNPLPAHNKTTPVERIEMLRHQVRLRIESIILAHMIANRSLLNRLPRKRKGSQ